MDPVAPLRTLAIRATLGEIVGADVLTKTSLDALVAGVDTPALRLLAGLTRSEESEAQELFKAVVSELELSPTLPSNPVAARWELVRWWCSETVAGRVAPEVAGDLIWREGWNELGYPNSLQPIVGWTSEWEDWNPSWGVERDQYRDKIVAEAQTLLHGPWPPVDELKESEDVEPGAVTAGPDRKGLFGRLRRRSRPR